MLSPLYHEGVGIFLFVVYYYDKLGLDRIRADFRVDFKKEGPMVEGFRKGLLDREETA